MSFKQGLSQSLRQNLGLVLTPQLRQRIEMLQMTKLELNDLVTQQLEENPVLDELSPEEISVAPSLGGTDFAEDAPASALNGLSDYDAGNTSYQNGAAEGSEFSAGDTREFGSETGFDSYTGERSAAPSAFRTTTSASPLTTRSATIRPSTSGTAKRKRPHVVKRLRPPSGPT